MSIYSDTFQWIFHPLKTLSLQRTSFSNASFWTLITLTGLSNVAVGGYFKFHDLLFSFLFVVGCGFILNFFHSTLVDFCAQLLGKSSQSLLTFKWFLLAQTPLILLMPLNLVNSTVPWLSSVFNIFIFLVIIYMLWLYVHVIKINYSVTTLQAVILLFSPLFLLTALPTLFGFGGFIWGVIGS